MYRRVIIHERFVGSVLSDFWSHNNQTIYYIECKEQKSGFRKVIYIFRERGREKNRYIQKINTSSRLV